MSIAYSRKSFRSNQEIIEGLKSQADIHNFKIIGETQLNGGSVISVCASDMLQKILTTNPQLIGLIPCSIAVTPEGEGSRVSVGDPSLISQVVHDHDLQQTVSDFQQQLYSLINQAAGVEALKPEKVKLYATTSCPYCKMEESWLKSNNIEFEEVLVDLNQEEAENLVRRTGQMGVPVTEVIYNDGEPDFVVGFDKSRLSTILNIQS